jgi:very-short-patch-repair endonuclease
MQTWVSVRRASGKVERQRWRPSWERLPAPRGIGSGSAPDDGAPDLEAGRAQRLDGAERASGSTLVPTDDGPALWVVTPLRAALDCLVELPLLQAVVAVDSALRAQDVTIAELLTAVADLRGVREAARARRAVALCDPRSGSVLESVLRFRLVEAGLHGFETQRVITSAGGAHLLRVDLCFESVRLVIEADGSRWHPDPVLDRRKDNQLAAAGWRVIRLTWAEVVHDPRSVVALVRAALSPVQVSAGSAVAA